MFHFIKENKIATSAACLILLACLAMTWLLTTFEKKRYSEALHGQTLKYLSQIRANLETEINSNFLLTRGMVAYIATHPDIDTGEFRHIASILLRHKNHIRNIALAPDNVISFIYPTRGNEKAMGLDYRKNKEQWPAVKKIIDTGRSVVAGPVQLIQGGSAFIFRTPVYILALDREHGDDIYWGLASIVIDKDALFQAAGFSSGNASIRMAIRGVDGTGGEGAYIDGDRDVFREDPVLLSVSLPEGSWQLGAVPKAGWAASSPHLFKIQISGFLFSLAAAFLTFFRRRKREQIRRKMKTALQEAQQATLAKSQVLANMSHEIRTPMNSIIGRTRLALDAELDQETCSHLNAIAHSSDVLLALINDILDISKIEAGELTITNRPFDFYTTIESCLDMARVLLQGTGKEVEITSTLSPNIPQCITGDALRLRQILLNLLSNAIKFTELGSIDLFVDSVDTDDDSLCLRFMLRDSGIGVAPEQQTRIFDQFSQGDSSSTREYGGTGLGLAISQKLCHLMGGHIEVISTPGQGSSFRFTLALQACTSWELPDSQESTALLAPAVAPLSLLLVEDNEANMMLAKLILEKKKHRVTGATNGLLALECLAEQQFDAIIMDVQMPIMDGCSACRIIRAAESDEPLAGVDTELARQLKNRLQDDHIPIIAMTANAMGGNREQCLAAGMDDYLSKPFDPEQLDAVLRGIISMNTNK